MPNVVMGPSQEEWSYAGLEMGEVKAEHGNMVARAKCTIEECGQSFSSRSFNRPTAQGNVRAAYRRHLLIIHQEIAARKGALQ